MTKHDTSRLKRGLNCTDVQSKPTFRICTTGNCRTVSRQYAFRGNKVKLPALSDSREMTILRSCAIYPSLKISPDGCFIGDCSPAGKEQAHGSSGFVASPTPALACAVGESSAPLRLLRSRTALRVQPALPDAHEQIAHRPHRKSLLVEREFWRMVRPLADADDPAAELASMRPKASRPSCGASCASCSADVALARVPSRQCHLGTGSLAVTFTTVEELATALWRLAMLLEEDLDGFALLYEPAPDTEDDQERRPDERPMSPTFREC